MGRFYVLQMYHCSADQLAKQTCIKIVHGNYFLPSILCPCYLNDNGSKKNELAPKSPPNEDHPFNPLLLPQVRDLLPSH